MSVISKPHWLHKARAWVRTAAFLSFALILQGASGEFFGCSTETTPEILNISPKGGVPGTEVTLRGQNFGVSNPLQDLAVVHFGDVQIIPRSADQVIAAEGIIVEWGNDDTITFRTPAREATNQLVDVAVETSNGRSLPVKFFDGDPGSAGECVLNPDLPDCAPVFTDFVGAVVIESLEELIMFRFTRGNVGTTNPTLMPVAWETGEDGRDLVRVNYDRNGYTNKAHDVRIDAFGNATLLLSQLPTSQPVDGVQGMVVFSNEYSEVATAYEGLVNPTRLASSDLGNEDPNNRTLAVVGEQSSQVDIHSGELFGNREQFNLAFITPAARPKAAAFAGTDQVLVVGTDPLTDAAWLASIDRVSETITLVDNDLGPIEPVDIVRYTMSTTTDTYEDTYIAYNENTDDGVASGILRRRVINGGEADISELQLGSGYRIGALLLDTASSFGQRDVSNNTSVPQLWFTVDDTGDANDDFVAALRLHNDGFPAQTSTYSDWRSFVEAEAQAAASTYTQEVANFKSSYSGAETAAAVDAAVTAPVADLAEIRGQNGGTVIVDGPFSLSLLPASPGEAAPTFVLVSNRDAEAEAGLLFVRTDAARAQLDSDGNVDLTAPALLQQPGSLEGYVWAPVALPGNQPGRLYCLQANN